MCCDKYVLIYNDNDMQFSLSFTFLKRTQGCLDSGLYASRLGGPTTGMSYFSSSVATSTSVSSFLQINNIFFLMFTCCCVMYGASLKLYSVTTMLQLYLCIRTSDPFHQVCQQFLFGLWLKVLYFTLNYSKRNN